MEKVTSKDGTILSVMRSGKGPPLLLVHGTTADHRRWSSILPYFEKDFTVYTIDRRGRGESGDSPDYHIMREAEDVAAVIDALGKPVFILGHSYGAICSLEGSLLTDKVSRLILYEPPLPTGIPLYPSAIPGRMQSFVDKGEFEAALELFFREIVKMPEHEFDVFRKLPAYKSRIQLAPTIPRELTFDRSYNFNAANFSKLEIPTLLLVGGDSPPIFRKAIEMVDSALPNSHVVILPGQQHIAMDTNPQLFVEEVLKFLKNE